MCLKVFYSSQMTDSTGTQLRQAREALGLSLERVSNDTLMSVRYLKALEAGEFDVFSSEAQVRGFLRVYADYLGVEAQPLLKGMGESSIEEESIKSEDREDTHTESGSREKNPDLIFLEIGEGLKNQREQLGLSLEDVERHTHLRLRYLKALELGDLDELPSPIQGRGMLNNYAVFLGMNPESVLLRFADGLQARLAARKGSTGKSSSKLSHRSGVPVSPLRRLFSRESFFGYILFVFLGVFVIWLSLKVFTFRSEDKPAVSPPSIAEVLLATPTSTHTATVIPPTETIPVIEEAINDVQTGTVEATVPPPAGDGAVQVYVTVRHRAWMRVLVDDEIEFEGRVLPGTAYHFAGQDRVEVLTGNGAALQVFFNQQDQGYMGYLGQVVHRVYTVDGVLTPTPTVTFTATATIHVPPAKTAIP